MCKTLGTRGGTASRAWRKVGDSQVQVPTLPLTCVLGLPVGHVFLVSRIGRMNDSWAAYLWEASGTGVDGWVNLGSLQPPKELKNYSVQGTPLPLINSIGIWVAGTQAGVFLKHIERGV